MQKNSSKVSKRLHEIFQIKLDFPCTHRFLFKKTSLAICDLWKLAAILTVKKVGKDLDYNPYFRTVTWIKLMISKISDSITERWILKPVQCSLLPRTTNAQWSLFSSKSQTFGLEQIIWAHKFWSIWGILGWFISTHFGTVSPKIL